MRIPFILALAICFFAPALTSAGPSRHPAIRQQAENSKDRTPRQLYQSLDAALVDGGQIFAVHDLTLRRDGVAFTFVDGKFAFLQPVDGHITGAVFSGRGRIFAVPPDPSERASLARFLKVPLIDIEFWQAYLRFDEATAAEFQSSLAEQKAVPATDSDFTGEWNPIVAHFSPDISLRVLESLLSSQPVPYLYATLNSTSFGSFEVVLDQNRPEDVLIGQARKTSGADFFDSWASYASTNSSPPAENFAAINYATDTTIGDDLSLTGTTTVRLRCVTGGERILEFELSRFLHVQSVTDASGNNLEFFQNQDLRRQQIARRGNDLLFVALPEQAVAGQEYDLDVTYHGTVIEDDGNGVYFVGARGSWYPNLAGVYQFASFDLKFRWPKRLTLVATGQQIESGEDGNQKTGEWRSTEPIAVAGFNLGGYAAQSVRGKPLIQLFANQQLEQNIAAQLQQFGDRSFLPNPAAVLKQLGGKLQDSIRYYEELNGPFPFPELDVSQIPGSFGQGWPGLLYLTTFVFLPRQAQRQAGLPEQAQEQVEELVPFHEVVHQWWGNIEAPASYRDAWLEEGMADYQSLMYDEKANPSKHALREWLLRYRDALLAHEPETGKAVDESGPLDFGYRLDSSKSPGAYRVITYEKGAWVMHMIRMMLRDPRKKNPDARFEELLRNTLADHRFKTLSSAQFEAEVQRLMTPSMDLENSRSMDWFFDQWVRQTGIPEYSLSFTAHPAKSRYLIEGSLEQRGVANIFTERIPIYAETSPQKSVFLGSVVTAGTSTRFRFSARFSPLKLLIDPEHTILCRTK